MKALLLTVLVAIPQIATACDIDADVRGLVAPDQPADGQKLKVAVGEFKYEGNVPGDFGEYIASRLGTVLSGVSGVEQVARKELKAVLEEQALTLTGAVEERAASKTGRIKGVDSLLAGDYWERGDTVEVNLVIMNVETGVKRSVRTCLMKADVPASVAMAPKNYKDTVDALRLWGREAGKSKELMTQLWMDSPTGVYHKGESIVIRFVANRDCFVRIYHTDSSGSMQMLFPNAYVTDNKIPANRVCSIPDQTMSFAFDVSEPYGAEMLRLVASTEQFRDQDDAALKPGEKFKSLGTSSPRSIRAVTRGIKLTPVQVRTDSSCVFTTAEK